MKKYNKNNKYVGINKDYKREEKEIYDEYNAEYGEYSSEDKEALKALKSEIDVYMLDKDHDEIEQMLKECEEENNEESLVYFLKE